MATEKPRETRTQRGVFDQVDRNEDEEGLGEVCQFAFGLVYHPYAHGLGVPEAQRHRRQQ